MARGVPLDAVQLVSLFHGRIRKVDPWRKLQPQVGLVVDKDLAADDPARQHVPAGAPVVGDEVEVVPGNVQAPGVIREPEADEAPRDVAQLEGGLGLYDLH